MVGAVLAVGWLLIQAPSADAPSSVSTTPPVDARFSATTTGWSDLITRIGSTSVFTRLAVTPETRSQGLSGQPALGAYDGLLFVFPDVGKPGFWMKDMNFAIDIIWIARNGTIVDITENFTPETFTTQEVVRPAAPVQYALEVPAFFAAQEGIVIGDQVWLPASLPVPQ